MTVTNLCPAYPIGMIMSQIWSSMTLNWPIQQQRTVNMFDFCIVCCFVFSHQIFSHAYVFLISVEFNGKCPSFPYSPIYFTFIATDILTFSTNTHIHTHMLTHTRRAHFVRVVQPLSCIGHCCCILALNQNQVGVVFQRLCYDNNGHDNHLTYWILFLTI